MLGQIDQALSSFGSPITLRIHPDRDVRIMLALQLITASEDSRTVLRTSKISRCSGQKPIDVITWSDDYVYVATRCKVRRSENVDVLNTLRKQLFTKKKLQTECFSCPCLVNQHCSRTRFLIENCTRRSPPVLKRSIL